MRLTIDNNTLSPRQELLLKVWGHLQRELLFICWALADTALLIPFLMAVMGWARYWQPGMVLLWALMLMLFAFNLTRLMSVIRLPARHQQTVMAIALFLVIVIVLPTFFHEGSAFYRFGWITEIMTAINETGNNLWLRDLIVFIAIALIWARGLQLGRREYSVTRAGLRLRVGGLMLAPVVVWMANTRLLWDSTPYILLFFLAGLTALALIRAQEIEQGQRGMTLALNPRWLTAVFIASLLIIFTAGTASVIISGETAEGVVGWLAPVLVSLRILTVVALTTLFYLLVPLFKLIDIFVGFLASPWFLESRARLGKIVGKFFINKRRVILPVEQLIAPQTPIEWENVEKLTLEASRNEQIIILLLAVALILFVALLVNRLYQETAVVIRQGSLMQTAAKEDEDGNALQRFLGRLGLWRNWQTAVSIRRIYRNMLRAADASGYPRLTTETPYEFLKTLEQAWPDNQAETMLITTAYVKVRYGELPETKAEILAIKNAWQRLEQTRPVTRTDMEDDR